MSGNSIASRGEPIENSLIGHEFSFMGHRFHILESARDTDDGSLRFDYSAPPGANVSEHVHRDQEESFEVISGRLGLRVGGRELVLTPGQSAIGPPKVPHAWWNPSDEERVRFLVGICPGMDVETMFETLLGLMREGKTIGPIPRNPLQTAVLARKVASWVVLGRTERVLLAPVASLAFVGKLLGYRASYPEYSGPEAAETARIEQSVEIERPPEEVFSFVADPRNDERWTPAVEETRKTSEGPLGAGATFEAVFRLLGRCFEAPFRDHRVRAEPEGCTRVRYLGTAAAHGHAQRRGHPRRHAAHHHGRGADGRLLRDCRAGLCPPRRASAQSGSCEPQEPPGSRARRGR